jgi:hypothetical protein
MFNQTQTTCPCFPGHDVDSPPVQLLLTSNPPDIHAPSGVFIVKEKPTVKVSDSETVAVQVSAEAQKLFDYMLIRAGTSAGENACLLKPACEAGSDVGHHFQPAQSYMTMCR